MVAEPETGLGKPMSEKLKADFEFWGDGTLMVLIPITEAATDWCGDHLSKDTPCRLGPGYVIEMGYFPPIYEGICEAGLTLDCLG